MSDFNYLRQILICLITCAALPACQGADEMSPLGNPVAVYNQAYQENFEADSVEDILKKARHAYVLLDPFLDDTANAIPAIKANGNDVAAYISIGTGETFRDDFAAIKPYLVSKAWGEWPDEYFVDKVTTGVLDVMKARIDKIAAWGFDWVEFDNMDWAADDDNRKVYQFSTTNAQAMSYYQTLCDYVHEKGMKCMAKNTVEGAEKFDGALYESYSEEQNWWDQAGAKRFLAAGKIVIVNHYGEDDCEQAYLDYKKIYGEKLSFICESTRYKGYVHFNQK